MGQLGFRDPAAAQYFFKAQPRVARELDQALGLAFQLFLVDGFFRGQDLLEKAHLVQVSEIDL